MLSAKVSPIDDKTDNPDPLNSQHGSQIQKKPSSMFRFGDVVGGAVSDMTTSFNEVQKEMMLAKNLAAASRSIFNSSDLTYAEHLSCLLENLVAVNPHAYFHLIFLVSLILTVLFGALWWHVNSEDYREAYEPHSHIALGLFFAYQTIATGGIDDSIIETGPIIVYFFMVLFGVIIFAALVGIITESFTALADGFSLGKTKVSDSGHTLVLGWNEATVRLICQIAFLRRAWRKQNETWYRWLLPWARVPPSTPVAKSRIVIMCNTRTKQEMQDDLENAFAERGISRKRTRIGWDIICRVGDPKDPIDLRRVGAHRATSIMVQMTEADRLEQVNHEGGVQNGATLRTLLALRAVLFGAVSSPDWENLRIVVQLASPSKAIEAATFSDKDGRQLVLVQDLSIFLNSLMFTCIAQPGLADVLLDLLGFDEVALRLKPVTSFREKDLLIGRTVQDVAYMFDNAVILGIENEKTNDGPTLGIAPNKMRPITESDLIIFAADSPSPELATEVTYEVAPSSSLLRRTSSMVGKSATHVLVCGWREAWSDPPRFAQRLAGTCRSLSCGSSLTFMNKIEPNDFCKLMEAVIEEYKAATYKVDDLDLDGNIMQQVGDDGEPHWYFEDYECDIYHFKGDPSVHDTLFEALRVARDRDKPFDQAIVLGTLLDNKQLSPESRDTRVMSIMLMMRYFVDKESLPHIHIIGENALDSTAALAIAPRKSGSLESVKPDFVNVQAICARALCQGLAYPRMNRAIRGLFSQDPESPSIEFRSAMDYVPLDVSVQWVQVVKSVREGVDCEHELCIGWWGDDGRFDLIPRLSSFRKYSRYDRLIVATRLVVSDSKSSKVTPRSLEGKLAENRETTTPHIRNGTPLMST